MPPTIAEKVTASTRASEACWPATSSLAIDFPSRRSRKANQTTVARIARKAAKTIASLWRRSTPPLSPYWQAVVGVPYTWRVMDLLCVTPFTVYVNVPLFASPNSNVALPTGVTTTCAGFHGWALNAGPVVR